MDGLFIVGPMNVMLYQEYNGELKEKFVQLAKAHGLLDEGSKVCQRANKSVTIR